MKDWQALWQYGSFPRHTMPSISLSQLFKKAAFFSWTRFNITSSSNLITFTFSVSSTSLANDTYRRGPKVKSCWHAAAVARSKN
jgi:hypothetical protein